ncbi:hypothetical protein DBP19_36145 [Streptomyces sp. CS090A]|uniref:hypothetical protein n=1 Tax=Streptomyces sp. CS090A TaxID=2162710 RepID=UPI000D50C6E9|nr:hypothetical protein [Streptomyces sp. CS090A]PVC80571.1 hypothetical protein DBP19_36145 [Streptomyces sp. CS090A]
MPVSATAMEVDTTTSRHTGPRNWLRSVEWLIAAGLHPKANQTTLAVAQDLAKRMDYSTGHVRYGLEDMAVRLDLDRSNVARHVKYLRELGSLAWAARGSRSNVKRFLGLPGYAATATVYAATIPAAYDHAMGHRIIGEGYEARAIASRQETPVAGGANVAESAVDNSSSGPVDNPAKRSLATPSLTPATYEGQVQMPGGVTTTARRQPTTPNSPSQTAKTNSGSKKRATILGNSVTAPGMRLGDRLARAIRRTVPWTRRATHDQLRWICADMGEQQWTEDQAVRFAVETGLQHAAGYAWNPHQPHRVLAAALRAANADQLDDIPLDPTHTVAYEDSTVARDRASLEALFALGQPASDVAHQDDIPADRYTDDDRLRARLDWNTWPEVARHYADDPDDALDLYGTKLCCYAVSRDARTGNSTLTHI